MNTEAFINVLWGTQIDGIDTKIYVILYREKKNLKRFTNIFI